MALTHPLPPPTPFNPVGFDWSKGSQNIGGTIYDPRMDRAYVTDEAGNIRYDPETGQPALLMTGDGESATYVMRPTGYNKYNEADRKLGNSYEVYDLSGNLLGRESFIKEDFGHGGFFEDLFGLAGGMAKEMAPLATFAIGAGPLAGMLGGAAASTLGISGLSAAQTAALGSAIAGGANTALQGGGIGDVLKSAVMTAAPSFVIPQIPTTGTPAVDAAIKAATQTAIRGGDIGSAVTGSLLNSGIAGATGNLGLDPKLVNFGIQAAQSGGDPNKIFNAITKLGPMLDKSSTGGYGGAETSGFFDAEEAQAVQDDIASLLARYPEAAPSFFPEFDAPLLTQELTTPITAPERTAFLEANIEDPVTVEALMQHYYPEIYAPAPVDNETAKFMRQQELAQAGESPLGGMGPGAKELPLINLSGPAPAPSAAPGKAPAPKAQSGVDLSGLFAFMGMMNQDEDKPDPYQVTQINAQSPFGTVYDQQQDLLGMIGRG